MAEKILISYIGGYIVRRHDEDYLLYRTSLNQPVKINRPTLIQLTCGSADLEVIESHDFGSDLQRLDIETSTRRAMSLFIGVLEIQDGETDFEVIADALESDFQRSPVYERVFRALLSAPLPDQARLKRLTALSEGRIGLANLTQRLTQLQPSVRKICRAFTQLAENQITDPESVEKFEISCRSHGVVQALILADDADLTNQVLNRIELALTSSSNSFINTSHWHTIQEMISPYILSEFDEKIIGVEKFRSDLESFIEGYPYSQILENKYAFDLYPHDYVAKNPLEQRQTFVFDTQASAVKAARSMIAIRENLGSDSLSHQKMSDRTDIVYVTSGVNTGRTNYFVELKKLDENLRSHGWTLDNDLKRQSNKTVTVYILKSGRNYRVKKDDLVFSPVGSFHGSGLTKPASYSSLLLRSSRDNRSKK